MEDLTAIKDYFKKLRKAILTNADFKFFKITLVKKSKVDDVLCCILATLPEIYKKSLKSNEARRLSSMIAYNAMFDAIKGKCPFNPNVYLVNTKKAGDMIETILAHLERDIKYLEQRYS